MFHQWLFVPLLLSICWAHHVDIVQRPKETSTSDADPCSVKRLAGVWINYDGQQRVTGDEFDIPKAGAQDTAGSFTVVVLRRVNATWTLAKGVIATNNTIALTVVDTGDVHYGEVQDDCSTIVWPHWNASAWRRHSGQDVVHIVAMNHLDVGYNGIPKVGFINNIINRYFHLYFPRAIAVASALRDLGGEERLIYTQHPWLLHMYLHCPENYTLSDIPLECPSAQEVDDMRAALKRGDVAFHAGPFNTEYENCVNKEAVVGQFALAKQLAQELGINAPTVVSLRDVPGCTRALVPIMASQGIRAISVGVNNGSPAPDMPNPGVWMDRATNTSVLFLQTGQGQGYPNNPGSSPSKPGGMGKDFCAVVPGFGHVLCFAFRTDNSGPPLSVEEVQKDFDIARWQFPGAKVVASTFDEYIDALEVVRSELPVATGEVGDNWITSTTADPVKMAWNRLASREYAACTRAGQCNLTDPRVVLFVRQLTKLPEHTYGLPSIADSANYTNAQFAAAYHEPAIQNALHSYIEQRTLAFEHGLDALGDHPLRASISSQWATYQPKYPDTSGLTRLPQAQWTNPLTLDGTTIAMDGATGALSTLDLGGQPWADGDHVLGQYLYQTFNTTVYKANPTCCWSDGNRQKVTHAQTTNSHGTTTEMWAGPRTLLAVLTLPQLQHTEYGAPQTVTVNATILPKGAGVALDVMLFNVTRTRLGGAHFLSFATPSRTKYSWLLDKLGSWVDPLDVVESGSQHQHAIRDGVRYGLPPSGPPRSALSPSSSPALYVDCVDSSVVSPAASSTPSQIFQFPLSPLDGPVTSISSQLMQNAFSTNTPLFQWDGDYRFRYVVRVGA